MLRTCHGNVTNVARGSSIGARRWRMHGVASRRRPRSTLGRVNVVPLPKGNRDLGGQARRAPREGAPLHADEAEEWTDREERPAEQLEPDDAVVRSCDLCTPCPEELDLLVGNARYNDVAVELRLTLHHSFELAYAEQAHEVVRLATANSDV